MSNARCAHRRGHPVSRVTSKPARPLRRLATSMTTAALLSFAVLLAHPIETQASERMTCTFELGNAWSYDAGKYASEPPKPLSFDVADIDLEAQSAKLYTAADKPPGQLRVVRAINANHFIEVANEGFLNLTTIYDIDPDTGAAPAVHSRHFGFLGQPIFAQYAGSCRAK